MVHRARRRRCGGRLVLVLSFLLASVMFTAAQCPLAAGNPGFGLLQFGGEGDGAALDSAYALGVNPLFSWSDLEPEEGDYNWAPLDDVLAAAHAKHKHVAPRVYTNMGDFDQATPTWVFAAGAVSYAFDAGSETPQPIPTDPVFTEKFATFLAALGERYDGDPDIEFFQTNAGMGGYGEMVWMFGDPTLAPGWSAEIEISTVRAWIDRWRAAFPRTHLAIMENPIGHNVAETLADYAVSNGFYLQANNPEQSPQSQAILARHADVTKIILEIENAGCEAATGAEFEAMTAKVFDYGFPIDYLTMCGQSFGDDGQMQATLARLRKGPVTPTP